jgi:hypothetical protein
MNLLGKVTNLDIYVWSNFMLKYPNIRAWNFNVKRIFFLSIINLIQLTRK